MKRFDPKNKYLGWGITAFGVIACCILFYMLLQHGKSIGDAISSLLGILSPIIWGLVIAYLLWPLTKAFQRKLFEPLLKKLRPKKPVRTSLARGLSVALSILVALIIIAALIWLIIPQIYTSVESIVLNSQDYYDTITGWINKFFENNPEVEEVLLSATGDVSDSLLDWAKTALLPSMGKVVTSVTTGIYAVLRAILDVLIGFVVACYVLSNMELFLAKSKMVLYSMFSVKASKRILKAIRFTDTAFMGFISGKVIDSAIIGVICYICCAIMRMPYVVLVSVVVGVTNIIPFFGPFLGAVPSALLLMIDKPVNALYFCIFILILQQVDGNIIENRILGEKLGISDFWVLVAILVFGGIFGFAGMLLGVPVFAVLYTVIGDRVNKRLARKRHPLQTSLYYTIRTVDDLPPVTEPSYTSAAEEPAYETQIDPDDDMEIDDPDYDDIPG